MCHKEQTFAQHNSLMQTEQGKIQGSLWGFGGLNGYNHDVGNYATQNPEDPHARLGSEAYQKYMQRLSELEPQVFPTQMKELPKAPTAAEVEANPQLSVYTYLRQECQRCHTGSKGRSARGDYRGIGCASCHIPYSNEGIYEGGDASIPQTPGHLLVHAIQSSREARVQVHDVNYSGVPVETCTTCHNRGKRIGVSYQGLMETEYQATFDATGKGQTPLHSKRYMHMKSDIHYQKGMLCQDCHTSNDLHGDGFLSGTTLAPVEIECQDCHGTTKAYPWELPLGYSDEFNTAAASGKQRGVAMSVAEYLRMGSVEEAKEEGKLSKEALTAMDGIEAHTENLECYTCHATWAPQCYGCHIKIDYSRGKQNIDYLAAAHDSDLHGRTGEMRDLKAYLIDGKVSETRSYLRWEDPPLSQNGEGRISPTIPGCQTTITVIGQEGSALLQNHIFKIPNVEGAGSEGQNAIDMSPVQPHTVTKEARSCESCHTNPKAAGYGIDGGRNNAPQYTDAYVDLESAQKRLLAQNALIQFPKIANLHHDWSVMLDENGTQVQTVGHHWNLEGPLSEEQRAKLDRSGACLSCHQSIPKGDLAVSAMAHMAQMAGVQIDNDMHQDILSKLLHVGAWVQVLGGIAAAAAGVWWWRRRRRKMRKRV